MLNDAADKRRSLFLSELVDLCIRHKVMVEPDGSEWLGLDADLIAFTETDPSKSELFTIDIGEVEEAVRVAVWPVVHAAECGNSDAEGRKIKTAEENASGLHRKYVISRADGKPIDERAVYFVLRLDGGHIHNMASRKAAVAWCDCILSQQDNQLTQTARELKCVIEEELRCMRGVIHDMSCGEM